jgi:hypothetical protein
MEQNCIQQQKHFNQTINILCGFIAVVREQNKAAHITAHNFFLALLPIAKIKGN